MKRSQKKANRRRVRQRIRQQDQNQRALDRDRNKYVPEKFVLKHYLRQHGIELAVLLMAAISVTVIVLMGSDKKAMNEMSATVSSGIEEQSQRWAEAYSYGYKVIMLTETDIIHTSFDTLPKDFRVDWDDLAVSRVKSTEFGAMNEKVKISLPGIDYAPGGVFDLTVTASFVRKEGAKVRLANLGKFEFVIEVVKDSDGKLYCLFGLQGG